MTFAPIHDFLPRKFPTEFADPVKNFRQLPAFVADRQTNQKGDADNPWLTSMFDTTSDEAVILYSETSKFPSGEV